MGHKNNVLNIWRSIRFQRDAGLIQKTIQNLIIRFAFSDRGNRVRPGAREVRVTKRLQNKLQRSADTGILFAFEV